jgi:hypothetical protein
MQTKSDVDQHEAKEESERIDLKDRNFITDNGLSLCEQVHKVVTVAPGPRVSETARRDPIREEFNRDIARPLGGHLPLSVESASGSGT